MALAVRYNLDIDQMDAVKKTRESIHAAVGRFPYVERKSLQVEAGLLERTVGGVLQEI